MIFNILLVQKQDCTDRNCCVCELNVSTAGGQFVDVCSSLWA